MSKLASDWLHKREQPIRSQVSSADPTLDMTTTHKFPPQNFTYTCLNSAAWYDTTTNSYANAIKLQGENEEEFSVANNKPNIIMDNCKVTYRNMYIHLYDIYVYICIYIC